MNSTSFRRCGAAGLMLCTAMLCAAACTPEQQFLLTAADKIISELKDDDEVDIESSPEVAAVPAPHSDGSP